MVTNTLVKRTLVQRGQVPMQHMLYSRFGPPRAAGEASLTVGAATMSAAGNVPVAGISAQTLGATTISAVGNTIPRDGPGNVYIPSTAAHFTTLGISTPSSVWLCQEASGNLADSIGAVTLTENNTPGYNTAVAGWTRTAVSSNSQANERFAVVAGTYPPAANSVAWLVYAAFDTDAVLNKILVSACATLHTLIDTAGKLRLTVDSNTATTAAVHSSVGGVTVRPVLFVYDRNASTAKLHTDLEEITATFADITVDATKGLFGVGGTSPDSGKILYAATWHGVGAQGLSKATLSALGWSLPY